MMTTPRMAFTSLALTALLVPGVALAGGSLTKADFERCNQQAMQVAGIADSQSPAASPGLSGSGAGTSGSMGTASPSSPGASTSGGAVGSSGTMSSPSASGSATSGSTSTGASTGAAGSSVAGSGTHSGTGSTVATGGADHEKLDRAVQAYRACLQQ
jgi:hypothetical protein